MTARSRTPGRRPIRDDAAGEGTVSGPDAGGGTALRLPSLLNRVVGVLLEGASKDFRHLGLSIPAIRALIGVHEAEAPLTVGLLAERTSIDLSTISHILRRLEADGLVTRARDVGDNRVVNVGLTARGRAVAASCREASLRHEAVLVEGLSPREVDELKAVLLRVLGNAKAGFAGEGDAVPRGTALAVGTQVPTALAPMVRGRRGTARPPG